MSRIGEFFLKGLLSAYSGYSKRTNASTQSSFGDYFKWQFESSPALFKLYPNWNPAGKRVLEIGCGIGGRTAYVAAAGASRAVGIDINAEEIATARELCHAQHPELDGRVEFHAAQENGVLDIGQFDVVTLIDAMEHVVSPPSIMRLAYSYLAPGGTFYFSNIGWYHHRGSHTNLLPWINLVFSDETIINVIRSLVSSPTYQPTRFDSDPPIERWRGLYDLRDRPGEHLNKITVRDVKRLLRYSIFSRNTLHIKGFDSPLARPFNFLRLVPGIQEAFHSYLIAECRK